MTPARAAARLAVAALAALLGCTGTLKTIAAPNPVPGIQEGTWPAVRNLATRRARLYDQFAHRATITATYLGMAEREARVQRLAEWQGWTEEEKARRLEAERAEAARYEEFLVAFYTSNRKVNDLDVTKSVWRIALKVDGGERVTHDATVLDMDVTVANLFPYIGPFDTVYRIRFDTVAGAPLAGRAFGLELASALGKLELPFGDGTVGPDRPPGTPLPE
jgi:hypothetical protein